MSLCALSLEAHGTLAEAIYRLGKRSNSREKGVDPTRYDTRKMSRIKQISSGRLGVTQPYQFKAEILKLKSPKKLSPVKGNNYQEAKLPN